MNTSHLRRWIAPLGALALTLVALVIILVSADRDPEPQVSPSLRSAVVEAVDELVAYDTLLWRFDDGEAGLARAELLLTYDDDSNLVVRPGVLDEITERAILLRSGTAYEIGDIDTRLVEDDGELVVEVEFAREWTVDGELSGMSETFRTDLLPVATGHRLASLRFRPESGWQD